MAISLKKKSSTVYRLELFNGIIYDIANNKTILFFKIECKKDKEEILASKLKFREQNVNFNNKITRWLQL